MFDWNLIFWILYVSAIVAVSAATVAFRNRHAAGGRPFFWMMIAVTEWCLVAAFEAAAIDLPVKIFFSTLEYIGFGFTVLFYLFFACEYTGKTEWLTQSVRRFLWAMPFLNLSFAVTNHWHRLLWTHFTPADFGHHQIVYHHGILFYVGIFLIYSYLASATLLLVSQMNVTSVLQKQQTRILVIATVIPWVVSLIYVANLSPIPGLNISPMSLLTTGILILHAVFRGKLLTLLPIAREQLLEQMWEGMIVIDNQNRMVDINKSAELLFNISTNQVVGQSLFKIFPDIQSLSEAIYSRKQSQIEIQWKQEDTKYLEFKITPLNQSGQKNSGYLLVCQDITERKQSEIAQEKLIQELKEANATKNRFFSIISHDLRNPFNNIFSFVRLMKEHISEFSQEEIVDLSNELYKSTKSANIFLETLLEWSRSQTGSMPFHPKVLVFKDICDSVEEILLTQASQKNIRLNFQVSNEIRIMADYQMTSTVIRNVVSNAIKFSYPGKEVMIKCFRDDGRATIQVIDQGTGMNAYTLENLFRLDKSISMQGTANEKGSGLGLILCKELTEKQGGVIEVESEEKVGSIFTVKLPLAEVGENIESSEPERNES